MSESPNKVTLLILRGVIVDGDRTKPGDIVEVSPRMARVLTVGLYPKARVMPASKSHSEAVEKRSDIFSKFGRDEKPNTAPKKPRSGPRKKRGARIPKG